MILLLLNRVFDQFTLEVILATAFGHQAEILRGNTESDELCKAAQAAIEVLAQGGIGSVFIFLAFQSKFILKFSAVL